MTHSYVCVVTHDSFICVCRDSFLRVYHDSFLKDFRQSRVIVASRVRYMSRLIRLDTFVYVCVCHDSFLRVCHDSFLKNSRQSLVVVASSVCTAFVCAAFVCVCTAFVCVHLYVPNSYMCRLGMHTNSHRSVCHDSCQRVPLLNSIPHTEELGDSKLRMSEFLM